jgi:hypothetical protein
VGAHWFWPPLSLRSCAGAVYSISSHRLHCSVLLLQLLLQLLGQLLFSLELLVHRLQFLLLLAELMLSLRQLHRQLHSARPRRTTAAAAVATAATAPMLLLLLLQLQLQFQPVEHAVLPVVLLFQPAHVLLQLLLFTH